MDEYWKIGIQEFGAVNITGFRIVQTQNQETVEFLNVWKTLNPSRWPGAGTGYISVSKIGFVQQIGKADPHFTSLLWPCLLFCSMINAY